MAEGKPGYGEAAPGDHLQTSYNLWLVGHQLEHGRAPWRDPYSFQPEVKPRWNLAGWPFGFVYWPLQAALGTVLAWNVFVLLGFLGAGGFTALWLREVGTPRGASLAGGLAFAMAPYLQAQWSAGHLLAWIAMLLPLSLYGLERARKGSDWWLALAGGALVSIPLSGQLHLALGAIPFFAAYALVRLPWAALLAVPALGAGLLADALAVSGTTGASGRQFRQVEHYSASRAGLPLARHARARRDRLRRLDGRGARRRRARRAHPAPSLGDCARARARRADPNPVLARREPARLPLHLGARPRATKHAGAGADDADRLPRARWARRRRRLEAALVGNRRHRGPAPARRPADGALPSRQPPIRTTLSTQRSGNTRRDACSSSPSSTRAARARASTSTT